MVTIQSIIRWRLKLNAPIGWLLLMAGKTIYGIDFDWMHKLGSLFLGNVWKIDVQEMQPDSVQWIIKNVHPRASMTTKMGRHESQFTTKPSMTSLYLVVALCVAGKFIQRYTALNIHCGWYSGMVSVICFSAFIAKRMHFTVKREWAIEGKWGKPGSMAPQLAPTIIIYLYKIPRENKVWV